MVLASVFFIQVLTSLAALQSEWVANVFISPLDLQFVHISKLFDANHFYHLHMFAFWIAPYTKQVSLSFLTVWFGWLHFTGHETISLDLLSFFINARWFNRWWLPALINRDFFLDGQSYKSDCCVPKVLAFSCPEFEGADFSHVAG